MLQMSVTYQLVWWNKYLDGIDKILIILLPTIYLLVPTSKYLIGLAGSLYFEIRTLAFFNNVRTYSPGLKDNSRQYI